MAAAFHQELLTAVEAEWSAMLSHPFLRHTATNRIQPEAFHRWLAQDFHYARELLRVMGLLLARVPYDLAGILLDGLGAMQSELALFEREAKARGVNLGVEMAPTCADYVSFLQATVMRADLAEAWAAFYAQEQAYLDCWRAVKSRQQEPSPYQSFIDNWSSAGFATYVGALAAALDNLAGDLNAPARTDLVRTVRRVVRYEIRFWDLALA